MRNIPITRQYTKHAEGSVLIEFGDTKVIATTRVEHSAPGFLRGKGQDGVTAEGHPYSKAELNSMLMLAENGVTELFAVQTAAIKG